ncbi:MAG: helix-turn-helix transcriptional regulator [Phycisphaerales bacterium]|jgi:DNA-binding Xre family transcriptional regulator|nr:helix-turn-helix transcriptional regulator [Phycisphaerales bacterium]MBT7171193.1 helix-turn-helix transcriptional regulator [Phycisphaerales bacterium]
MPRGHNVNTARLAALLHQHPSTEGEIAKMIGITGTTLSRIKNGQPARMANIKKIAKVLEVSASELIGEELATDVIQDMYTERLNQLIAGQPEHVRAEILGMVARELARREKEGDE